MPSPAVFDSFTTTGRPPVDVINQMTGYFLETLSGKSGAGEQPTGSAISDVQLASLAQLFRLSLPPSVSAVESQLDNLADSEAIEVKPTNYARFNAKRTVIPAYIAISKDKATRVVPPAPTIGTDDVGGIMLSWVVGEKYLLANFGAKPDSKSFIYFEQRTPLLAAGLHDVEQLNDLNLAGRLKWLAGQ